jgi:hypothetical protein
MIKKRKAVRKRKREREREREREAVEKTVIFSF